MSVTFDVTGRDLQHWYWRTLKSGGSHRLGVLVLTSFSPLIALLAVNLLWGVIGLSADNGWTEVVPV
jgi:hypothetical protein